jgi:hypothetical protein
MDFGRMLKLSGSLFRVAAISFICEQIVSLWSYQTSPSVSL